MSFHANVNVCHIFLQMWRPTEAKVYLPPVSVSKVVSTEEYVTRTNIYYYAGSTRLLAVGHPYYPIKDTNGKRKIAVPKVSGLQYRVFRIRLPDPNKFGFPDASFYNPDKERLVWACAGVEVGRGQPLGIGTSGNPFMNKLEDTENAAKYIGGNIADSRECMSVDYKQTQLCIVGCKPPLGEHWGTGTPCATQNAGECPPLELKNTTIQDGDMIDVGFGAMDFKALQANKSDVPIDISNTICKYPDYLGMAADPYGDSMWFYIRREQMFVRHLFNRAGTVGDAIPDDLMIKGTGNTASPSSCVFYPTPSGSMVSSDAQIFNKPYWLQKAQGQNNGICWHNQLFLTVVDTTRSTNFSVCVGTQSTSTNAPYANSNFKEYLRHAEEYDLQFVFQLCKINLTTDVMTYIHSMSSSILEQWNFGLTPPPSGTLEETYRYVTSQAITCQRPQPPKETEDPYGKMTFWEVDLKEKFSAELDQFALGRKFLLQLGMRARPRLQASKRSAPSSSSTAPKKKRAKRI